MSSTPYDGPLAAAFPALSRTQLDELSERVRAETYQPGETIVAAGDTSDALYVVVDGEVDVLRPEGDGEASRIETLTQGQVFGEIGLLWAIPRTATVVATKPTEVVRLDEKAVVDLISSGGSEELERVLDERIAADRTR